MEATETKSICYVCGKTIDDNDLLGHLQECLYRHVAAAGEGPPERILLINVADDPDRLYSFHAITAASTTLAELDRFLRDLWLECCDHNSTVSPRPTLTIPVDADPSDLHGKTPQEVVMEAMRNINIEKLYEQVMAQTRKQGEPEQWFSYDGFDISLADAFKSSSSLVYTFDFSDATDLAITLTTEWRGPRPKNPIVLLTRNLPPAIECEVCGRPAAFVEPGGQEGRWLCGACAPSSSLEREQLLPIVNSPRVGQCSYAGPKKGWQPPVAPRVNI